MCQSVLGHGYNIPPFVDLKYIQLLDVGKNIINSEKLLLLPSLKSLKPLCSFIYGPTLIWLACFSHFSIYLQLFHSLFLLVFLLSYWARDLPILLYMLESLTLYRCYDLLECSNDSAVRQLYFTENHILKRAWYDQ